VNRLELGQSLADSPALNEVRVVSVLSGKGGVGKSIIAFNLACQIASLGYRLLLVDADISSGNVHILANVSPDCGVEQFASGQLTLRKAVTHVNELVDILAAPAGRPIPELQQVTGAGKLVKELRQQGSAYDFIILDHSSGVSDHATVIAHASDLNLLVLVPELTSIADAYGLYKYLVQANDDINCCLFINRVKSREESDYVQKRFGALAERFLGRVPVFAGCMFEDPTVSTALAAQKPIVEVAQQCVAGQSLMALSRMIVRGFLSPATDGTLEAINKTATMADIRG